MVSPRRLGTKYSPLSRYLLRRGMFTEKVTLPFAQIEAIIDDNLPMVAIRDNAWWGNNRHNTQGRAWLNVGWEVQNVDLISRTATFYSVTKPQTKRKEKNKRNNQTPFATKTFRSVRVRKLQKPSKTRIAITQARLKNLERGRLAMRSIRGKFKHRPAYEKRLCWPEASLVKD
jgi:hypothetical protein